MHQTAGERETLSVGGRYAVGSTDPTLRTAARVAGFGLLLMAALAAFANFYVLGTLVVTHDAEATVQNLRASAGLFRVGIVCFLLVAALDVVVAWGLYVFFEPASKPLSLLAAWFRLAYAPAFALALTPLLTVLYLVGMEAPQENLTAQVLLSLSAFQTSWQVSLVLFGFHLLVLGVLVFRSGVRWLGVLLGVAALGYLTDSFGTLLTPDYPLSLAAFTFVGEVALLFWLVWLSFRGVQRRLAPQPLGAR